MEYEHTRNRAEPLGCNSLSRSSSEIAPYVAIFGLLNRSPFEPQFAQLRKTKNPRRRGGIRGANIYLRGSLSVDPSESHNGEVKCWGRMINGFTASLENEDLTR